MAPGARRVAAIDVGSNSIRLVVADVTPSGTITVVDELRKTPRLGAGLHETGVLGAEAMRGALDALGRMVGRAAALHPHQVVAVATSAVRDAANGADFLRRVQDETGLALRVLDGDAEARLAFRSAQAHFDLGAGRTIVMDIGGGSLELAPSTGGEIDRPLSYPLGAIRLTERFLATSSNRRAMGRLRAAVRAELAASLDASAWRDATLIGSGGTFTTLTAILCARRGAPADEPVHATVVPREELEGVLEELRRLTPSARRRVPG
jgi:exopolyphosphatase/guanosine-5'-triphosphate,3'-diphosphate pyrophosphatase